MNSEEQAQGEKRVLHLLVEPLKRRGLAKPSALTVADFGEMVSDMCARLAYMSEASLMALEEQVAANPGGKDRDRFPIANAILQWAADIQPPSDGASPLIRAVFAHACGQDAISEGWAPELLAELRRHRRWPSSFVLKTIRDDASRDLRRWQDLRARTARGEVLDGADLAWWDRREAAVQRCSEIATVEA